MDCSWFHPIKMIFYTERYHLYLQQCVNNKYLRCREDLKFVYSEWYCKLIKGLFSTGKFLDYIQQYTMFLHSSITISIPETQQGSITRPPPNTWRKVRLSTIWAVSRNRSPTTICTPHYSAHILLFARHITPLIVYYFLLSLELRQTIDDHDETKSVIDIMFLVNIVCFNFTFIFLN